MTFKMAIEEAKHGAKIRLKTWNENMYAEIAKNISYENLNGDNKTQKYDTGYHMCLVLVGIRSLHFNWYPEYEEFKSNDWCVIWDL